MSAALPGLPQLMQLVSFKFAAGGQAIIRDAHHGLTRGT
jgi:hypothetical protein